MAINNQIYPIIWGPEQSRGNWGAKIEEARHQWHIKLGQSHRGHRIGQMPNTGVYVVAQISVQT